MAPAFCGHARALTDGGRIVIRTPNMASPFALGMQFNDVTHLQAYSPGALRQVARAAGFDVAAILPQAYGSWRKEAKEWILTATLSWFMAAPPPVWTPNFIAVLRKA